MPDGSGRIARRILNDDEVSFLRFGLRLDASPDLQKRTLQMLCEYYEAGRLLRETGDIRQMIHSHMSASNVLVRRWAIKALALIGHQDDFQRIVDRLRVETDVEAQTWGVTGLVKNAQTLGLKELCNRAGLPRNSAIALAARLYAPKKWLAQHAEQVSISLHDDVLTLKWATFLIGYNKAPEDLFDPKHKNEIFLGELNAHDDPDISEYSLWALWSRNEFGAGYSKIPLDAALKHTESVRKWLYRLAAKSPTESGLTVEAFAELSRDPCFRARDGLALGIADLDPSIFAAEALGWYTIETNSQVRENLIVSMAKRGAENIDYADAVEQHFIKEQADSALRRRLLAASVGTSLYGNLQRIHIGAEQTRQGLSLFTSNTIIGTQNMTGSTVNIAGNVNAQNFAIGDMINSANGAVQKLNSSDPAMAEVLRAILEIVRDSKGEGGKEVATAVEKVATAPSAETKQGLMEKLKDYASKAAAIGTAVGGVDKLIEAIQHFPL